MLDQKTTQADRRPEPSGSPFVGQWPDWHQGSKVSRPKMEVIVCAALWLEGIMVHLLRSAQTTPIRMAKSFATWLLLPLVLAAIASCRGGPTAEQGVEPNLAPAESVEPAETDSDAAAGEAPINSTEPTPAGVETPSATAPAAVVAESSLPDSLLKAWEPASQVLYEFGEMTITADQIQWAKGQSSAYTVINAGDGYLLNLTSAPSFFDTAHPYIRLEPQTDGDTITEVEVAFYENEAAAKQDQYIMYGSYF